jgi:Protein of unknown function (DUF3617)
MRAKVIVALVLHSFVISAFVFIASSGSMAADKSIMINVKGGLWETTLNMSGMAGMPGIPDDVLAKLTPEQRAQMEAMMKQRGMSSNGHATVVKSCVTKEKIEKGMAFSDEKRENCTHTIVNSTPTHAEIKLHCEMNKDSANKATVDSTTVIDVVGPDSTKGTTHAVTTSNGRNMTSDMTFTSKYLGADCGDIQ